MKECTGTRNTLPLAEADQCIHALGTNITTVEKECREMTISAGSDDTPAKTATFFAQQLRIYVLLFLAKLRLLASILTIDFTSVILNTLTLIYLNIKSKRFCN